MSEDAFPFPTRFRGYDRDAVHRELHELRTALEFAHADRDRAVARALALEHGDANNTQMSATVQWLIDTAEQDAQRIRSEAQQVAAEYTQRAEELLRCRVELIEQAQHEAAACRGQAAEEARGVIQDALEKASTLLRGLRESEQAIRELFDSGALAHRMPPPRRAAEDVQAQLPLEGLSADTTSDSAYNAPPTEPTPISAHFTQPMQVSHPVPSTGHTFGAHHAAPEPLAGVEQRD